MRSLVQSCLVFAFLTLLVAGVANAQSSPPETAERKTETDGPHADRGLTFRQLASLPTRDQDAFKFARVAVSFDQQALISRNYIRSGGVDVRGRVHAYLWSLNPDDARRTELPDSTTFGFVPQSNLAFQVHWGSGVVFWDTRTHTRSGAPIPHALREDTTLGPAVSPNGEVLVTRSQLDHLRFWNIGSRQPITPERRQSGIVYGLWFSDDSKLFFSKTGKDLTVWKAGTGELIAGPFRHAIYNDMYLPTNGKLVTFETNSTKATEWKTELIVRGGETFAEVERFTLSGRAREAHWIDEQHLLVVADYRNAGESGPFTYRKRLVYLVRLMTNQPIVRKLWRQDWIRGATVAPDRKHFVVRSRDETRCWKLGVEAPVWSKPRDPQVYFGDQDWLLLRDQTVTVCSVTDGKPLWSKNDVEICRVSGPNIWLCKDDAMEVWRVERSRIAGQQP